MTYLLILPFLLGFAFTCWIFSLILRVFIFFADEAEERQRLYLQRLSMAVLTDADVARMGMIEWQRQQREAAPASNLNNSLKEAQ